MLGFEADTTLSLVAPEFQAVVIAGYGTRLAPLTEYNGDEARPKALLPIGNRPMISYGLTWLEEAGIRDVLLICPSSHRSAISHHIHSDVSFPSLRIEVQPFDGSEDRPDGACGVLRKFASKIKTDFIVLPCDFIPPVTLPLSALLNMYRMDTDGMIMASLFHEQGDEPRRANDERPPVVIYDEKSRTLLHVNTDDSEDDFEVRMSLLWKFPSPKLTTKLVDAHVYVFRRTVLDLLPDRPDFDSIRHDLIPWLCKMQYQPKKQKKWGTVLHPVTNVQNRALQYSTAHLMPTENHKVPGTPDTESGSVQGAGRSSTRSSAPGGVSSPVIEKPSLSGPVMPPSLKCGILVHRLADGYAARANMISTYAELNRQCLREGSYIPSFATVDPKAQVSSDSIVGRSTIVGERTSIKKSVIGRHCVIGKHVKIGGCVIMDHVEIADGAKIDNCILSPNTRVGERAQLKDCESQGGTVVDADASFKGETLD